MDRLGFGTARIGGLHGAVAEPVAAAAIEQVAV